MPQFDVSFFCSQLFWLTFSFSLFWTFVAFVVVPRISGDIMKRNAIIEKNLAAAQNVIDRIKEIEREIDRLLLEARSTADIIILKTKKKSDDNGNDAFLKLSADIENITDLRLSSIRNLIASCKMRTKQIVIDAAKIIYAGTTFSKIYNLYDRNLSDLSTITE